MKSSIILLAAAMVVAACGSRQQSGEIEIILPEKDKDVEGFINAIKSIEVIDLEVDSNYIFIEDADLRVSDNYYYFVPKYMSFRNNTAHLVCYDKATGKIQFSKLISGRSQAEVTEISGSFIVGDKIVLNDYGSLKMYDHTGRFCGVLGEGASRFLLPLGDGFVSDGYNDGTEYLCLLDSAFNEKEIFFELPQEYMIGSLVETSTPCKYVINDNLHFLYPFTYRLHSFPDNKTYHFITSNPIPESLLSNPNNNAMMVRTECYNNGYANDLDELVENQDYISFVYVVGFYDIVCRVLISKRDNKVFCIGGGKSVDESEVQPDSPNGLWASLLFNANFIYSDGKYFYMSASERAYKYWEEHKNNLDARQKNLFEKMQSCFAKSEDEGFKIFLKIEF